MEAPPLWERSKENAAPLQRGRNVRALEASLNMDSQQQAEQERMVAHYETLIRPSEASDFELASLTDDPLIHWLSYIKFHQDTFPSDKHAQFLLFERCLRSLSLVDRYRNDVRFIRVCCMYAEQTDQPSAVFQHLHSQKIGVETALFWMAWGFVAEHMQDYKLAEKIYSKGIRKKAKPVEKLAQRYRQFQRRMTRHWLNSTSNSHEEDQQQQLDDESGGGTHGRGALGALSEDAIRRNHRSRASNRSTATFTIRQDASHQPSQSSTTTNENKNKAGGFTIFSEENTENNGLDDSFGPAVVPRRIETQQDRRKENTQSAETWNGRGGYQSSFVVSAPASSAPAPRPQAPAFAVFVDEECAQKQAREQEARERLNAHHDSVRDDRKFKERKEGVADRLSQDPLRYVRDPSQLAVDQAAAQPAPPPPVRREKKSNIMAFDKYLLKNEQGKEQCFEEARLARKCYRLASVSANVNELCIQVADSSMSVEESMDDVTMDDFTTASEVANVPQQNRLRFLNASTDAITPRNASTASSTIDENLAVGAPTEPTINTQLALKELSMMFSSPGNQLQPVNQDQSSNSLTAPPPPEDSGDTADLGAINELFHAENSDENDGPRNPEARSADIPGFDRLALRALREEQGSTGITACTASAANENREIGPIAQSDPLQNAARNELTNNPGFSIFNDEEATPQSSRPPSTAGFSIYQEEVSAPPKAEPDAKPAHSSQQFSIFQDASPVDVSSEGDTATLSLFGEAMATLQDEDAESSGGMSCKRQKRLTLGAMPTPPAFGDISRIAPAPDETMDVSGPSKAADYNTTHDKDMKHAIAMIKTRGRQGKRANSLSLKKVLGQRRVHHLPDTAFPQNLKGQKSSMGSRISIGTGDSVVAQELGRGAYGVVALVEIDEERDSMVAVKAQSPVECLAWEYRILETLTERLEGRCTFFFPRPMSFVSLSDGAMLSMTAGSRSGLNLVDLVNVYSVQLGESIPEVLVLYYAARMLHHLEMLHWHGKVLHCDTKPDNWVLVSSNSFGGENIEGSDLMLVDFGRAKDLVSVSSIREPLDAKYSGNASAEEMQCVAMRKGAPWSFDIDTYGLCASVHVLLFGSHMQVTQKEGNRWMPTETFRRYHQRELWTSIFDTLLNLEFGTKTAIGSRPMSLRQIRQRLEAHLSTPKESRNLVLALKHQAAALPEVRLT